MKVLFLHNKYATKSGEEVMIDRIMNLMRSRGQDVMAYFRDSRELDTSPSAKIGAFFSGIYSYSARRELTEVLEDYPPDIVQVQNLYPLISPSVLSLLRKAGIPVVMRLSNYRLVCPSGLLLSHGELCNRCLGGKEYWCVLRNCEESISKSMGYALRNFTARSLGMYSQNVTRYYAQTEFQKNLLVSEGFSESSIDVIPNMVQPPGEEYRASIGDYVGFAGRMSTEKGIDVFIEAARRCPDIPFKIAGEKRDHYSDKRLPENVEVLGHLGQKSLKTFYRDCRFLVVPSLWYEGFPSVIIEAMRTAKPVIASRIGGLPEIVDDGKTGCLFEPGDVGDLAQKVRQLWNDDAAVRELGAAGRAKVIRDYLPDIYYKRLMATYEKAISQLGVQRR